MRNGMVIVIVIMIVFGWLVFGRGGALEAAALDKFAQCLTDKGFVMYGAYWCPHCQNEKAAFGDSFKFVNYVECTEEPKRCVAARIEGFPTWITDNGRRFEGEQGVLKLAEISGCSLNNSVIPAEAGIQDMNPYTFNSGFLPTPACAEAVSAGRQE